MSSEFYPDSKTDIVKQINAACDTHVTADNVSLEIYDGSSAIVGDGKKYSRAGKFSGKARDLSALFGNFPIIVTDFDLYADGLKIKDYLPLVNEQLGTNISVDDITNGDRDAPKPLTQSPGVTITFVGNRVSLLNDFNVIIMRDKFNLTQWLEQATTLDLDTVGWVNGKYQYRPQNFTAAGIRTSFFKEAEFTINPAVDSPVFILYVDDFDKLNLKWPSSIRWLDSDLRNFGAEGKFYFFLTRDGGKSYLGTKISKGEDWGSFLFKIQERSVDDKEVNTLLEGHDRFLKNNTGKIVDPHTDHFVINEKDVLVNNRHFTYNTRQEGQPDSDATTEGHSLLITGYIEAYRLLKARGNEVKAAEYLAAAEKYFISYIEAFYAGELPPDVPFRWSSNWIVNGKAPVLAHYPLAASDDFPTHGGFIDINIEFEDGVGQIPAGAPHWGEYLDVVGKVYTGAMGWQRIDATPYLLDSSGALDWKSKGTIYPVDYICTWSFEKISGDGDKLGMFGDVTAKGTIALKDKTFNGALNVSFAVRLPVEHGGYMLATNECQHNRPLQVPVNNLFRGNASDAEQWFCEAAYDLWKITGDDLYEKAYKASLWTIMEYTTIDANDKFIRKVKGDVRYDTDGITYYYTYPSKQPVKIDRNVDGYIRIRSERAEGLQFTMEQNAIPFRVNRDSILQLQYGGIDDKQGLINARAQLVLSIDKSKEKEKVYNIPLPPTTDSLPVEVNIPIGSLVEVTENDIFELMAASAITWSENTLAYQKFDDNVFDGRTASVLHAQQNDIGDMQFSVGLTKKRVVTAFVYRTNIDMNVRVIDSKGWRWWVLLPASTDWSSTFHAAADWKLASYQTNPETDPRPTAINWGDGVDEITFLPDGDSKEGDYIDIYSMNGVPATYSVDDGYTMLFNITFYMEAPATVYIGDCTIKGQRLDALPYTPGIIPFSNNSVPNAPTFDSWRGQPYPGYQYPFYYALQSLTDNPNRDIMIGNVIDFWYDSQQWYHDKFGVLGPGASAYVWNRWDMPDGEEPDTWTMYHFGTNVAWSGYQPRAFYAAVKMYETMSDQKLDIPIKLVKYIKNWLTFLRDYVKQYKMVPTDYPVDKAPAPLENDFTGHMSGLYLAGVSKAMKLGLIIDGQIELMRAIYQEIVDNYVQRPGYPDIMNGSWSPAPDSGNNGKDGMFFGFWAGEIMRGISLYSECVQEYFPNKWVIAPRTIFREMADKFDIFRALAGKNGGVSYDDVTENQIKQIKLELTRIFGIPSNDSGYTEVKETAATLVTILDEFGKYDMDPKARAAVAASFMLSSVVLATSGDNMTIVGFSDKQGYSFVSSVDLYWEN